MQTQRNPVETQFPSKSEADEIGGRTWAGVDASERLESDLARMDEGRAMTVEQVGVLTLLADSLEVAGDELATRGRKVRRLAVEVYQCQAF